MANFNDGDLRMLLRDFSLNEQLTRSRKGLYHASINPREDSSRELSDGEWLQAVNVLAEELGFEEQRRAIVLHKKHGRVHAHVAFERYSNETGKMKEISHNYRKHDNARARLEMLFKEQPTPTRNPNRDDMKLSLTGLWKATPDAKSFISAVRQAGYHLSSGYDRRPYMVIDKTGRSFDLVRLLEGVKVKEARERFKDTTLLSEREAVALARNSIELTGAKHTTTNEPGKEKSLREDFAERLARQRQQQQQQQRTLKPRMR